MGTCKPIFFEGIDAINLEIHLCDDGGICVYTEGEQAQLSLEQAVELAHTILTNATLCGHESKDPT